MIPSVQATTARVPLTVLDEVALLLAAPMSTIAASLSELLVPHVSHSALLILSVEDVGHPLKTAGDTTITAGAALDELRAISDRIQTGEHLRHEMLLGGESRSVLAAVAQTDAVLVLTDPGRGQDELVARLWEIVAVRIQHHAREASPTYLMGSRAAASVRAQAVNDLADRHTTTLESLLGVLRSTNLDDRGARQTATSLATEAVVRLRTATDRILTFTEEPVTSAFERLRDDLRPLVKYRDVDVQFVEPPVEGRALPSEIAHGARAVVRNAILALADQDGVKRIRVQWDCDGKNLLIDVRDDGPGRLSMDSLHLRPLQQRVMALNGRLSVTGTGGWGSEMSVVMPLDPPPLRHDESRLASLSLREHQVVRGVVAGLRNRNIAQELGISENTVKFHLRKIFRKLDVTSRAELATLALKLGGPIYAPSRTGPN
jgi:DNA-binding CsgD family transcriptional regulator/signal transduction histidine kinase